MILALLLAMPVSVLFDVGGALPSVPNRGAVFDPGLSDTLEQSGYAARVLFDAALFSGRGPIAPYRMYFVNSSGAMQLALSNDGMTWTNHTTSLTGLFSCLAGAAGTVIYDAAGFGRAAGPYFRIYYSNCATSWNAPINTAVSSDGVNWQNDTTIVGLENRESFEARVYGIGGLVFQPEGLPEANAMRPLLNRWLLYYVAGPVNGSSQSIGLAVSRDGVNFARLPVHVLTPQQGAWDSKYVGAGTVTRIENGTLSLWYSGGSAGTGEGVGLATSLDGVVWARQTTSPIFVPEAGFGQVQLRGGPSVVFDANRFRTAQGTFTGDGSQYKLWQNVLGADAFVRVAYASVQTPAPVFDPSRLLDRTVVEGQEVRFWVTATDPSGGTVTISSPPAERPPGSSVLALSNSSILFFWTPTVTQAGSYVARFTGRTTTAQATATVNITVLNLNRAPTARITGPQFLAVGAVGNYSASTSSDPDADALGYSWTLPDGSSSSSVNVSLLYPTLSDEGTKLLSLKVTDPGGLFSVANMSIVVDGVAPSTTHTLVGIQRPNGYYSTNVTMVFNITDNLAGVGGGGLAYNLNGGAYTNPPGTSLFFNFDGTHTVGYYSTDHAGNAETPHSVTFSVSRVGPALAITAPERLAPTDVAIVRTNSINIVASATDPNGVATVEFFVDGTLRHTATGPGPTYTFLWNAAASGTGPHAIKVVATDAGGSSSEKSFTALKTPV